MPELVYDPSVTSPDTPDYLVPKMDQYATSDPVYFRQLVIQDAGVPPPGATELSGVLDPFGELPGEAPGSPKQGVLLTFEQAWYQKGLALGRLLHSISLAPGEVTQVAVIDFARQSRAAQSEAATQDESLSATNNTQLADREVQNAVASELQYGSSQQSSMSMQDQMASGYNLLWAGTNMATSTNRSVGVAKSTSESSSQIAADSVRNLQQSALAASQAVRSRRAAQVIETNERESQTVTSRVIANYNHMHALNVLFFEVVQVFQLSSRVCGAERAVFIPMRETVFDEAAVRRHWRALAGILLERGLKTQHDELVKLVDTDTAAPRAALEVATQFLSGALTELVDMFAALGSKRREEYSVKSPNELDMERLIVTIETKIQMEIDHRGADAVTKSGEYQMLQARLNAVRKGREAWRAARKAMLPAQRVIDFLATNQLWFNQQLWLRLDASRVRRLVAGRLFRGESLEDLMDPRPLGVLGNLVAFRLPHAEPGGDAAYAAAFVHRPGDRNIPKAQVALPSGGIFGEAVLGQGMAAERIDLTRFWNWQDSPIPILPPAMAPIDAGSRARDTTFTRVELDAALAQLQTMAPPERANFDALINKIKEGFRDMSSREQLAATIGAQTSAAASGAATIGEQFVSTLKATQEFAIGLANSDVGKAAMAAVMAPAGGGGVSTVMGGILGASKAAAPAVAKDEAPAPEEGDAPPAPPAPPA